MKQPWVVQFAAFLWMHKWFHLCIGMFLWHKKYIPLFKIQIHREWTFLLCVGRRQRQRTSLENQEGYLHQEGIQPHSPTPSSSNTGRGCESQKTASSVGRIQAEDRVWQLRKWSRFNLFLQIYHACVCKCKLPSDWLWPNIYPLRFLSLSPPERPIFSGIGKSLVIISSMLTKNLLHQNTKSCL